MVAEKNISFLKIRTTPQMINGLWDTGRQYMKNFEILQRVCFI